MKTFVLLLTLPCILALKLFGTWQPSSLGQGSSSLSPPLPQLIQVVTQSRGGSHHLIKPAHTVLWLMATSHPVGLLCPPSSLIQPFVLHSMTISCSVPLSLPSAECRPFPGPQGNTSLHLLVTKATQRCLFPLQLLYSVSLRKLGQAEPGIPLVLTQNMVSVNGLFVLAKWLSPGIAENALLGWLTTPSPLGPLGSRRRMVGVHQLPHLLPFLVSPGPFFTCSGASQSQEVHACFCLGPSKNGVQAIASLHPMSLA